MCAVNISFYCNSFLWHEACFLLDLHVSPVRQNYEQYKERNEGQKYVLCPEILTGYSSKHRAERNACPNRSCKKSNNLPFFTFHAADTGRGYKINQSESQPEYNGTYCEQQKS